MYPSFPASHIIHNYTLTFSQGLVEDGEYMEVSTSDLDSLLLLIKVLGLAVSASTIF